MMVLKIGVVWVTWVRARDDHGNGGRLEVGELSQHFLPTDGRTVAQKKGHTNELPLVQLLLVLGCQKQD